MTEPPTIPDLHDLVRLFYARPGDLARIFETEPASMPPAYRRLLAHNQHMTVTIEEYHGSLVEVRVLEEQTAENSYARKILLSREDNGEVVQFGVVRLDVRHLGTPIVAEIREKQTPLGRILINRNVLREVELSKVWRLECGDELAGYFQASPGTETFGRTALIYCDGDPAIELLEIVAPVRAE